MISLLFGLLLAAAGIIAPIFFNPFWGLAVFSCFTHMTPMQLHIEVFRMPLIISLVTLASYLFGSKYKEKFTKWPIEFWLLIIMLLAMMLSGRQAYNVDAVWVGIDQFYKMIIFFLLLVNIIDSRWKFEWFINALILSAAWMVYKCWDLRGTTGARFEYVDGGIVMDSNQYAAALILLLPLVIAKILKPGHVAVRIGALFGAFGMLMSIIITVSRGGFIGIGGLCFASIIFFKKIRFKLVVVMLAVGFAASPFVPQFYYDRISSIFVSSDDSSQEQAGSSRRASWALAVELWQDRPFLGVGLKNFGYYMAVKEGKTWGERGHVAHSLWLQPLAEGGLMLFIPFVSILMLFFYRTWKVKKNVRGSELDIDISALQVGMFAFLVAATFIDRLFYEPIYWWSALGVALSYYANSKEFDLKNKSLTK